MKGFPFDEYDTIVLFRGVEDAKDECLKTCLDVKREDPVTKFYGCMYGGDECLIVKKEVDRGEIAKGLFKKATCWIFAKCTSVFI